MYIDDEKQNLLFVIDRFESGIIALEKTKNANHELFTDILTKRIEHAKHEIDKIRKRLKEMEEPKL
jgi:hypothetical protein